MPRPLSHRRALTVVRIRTSAALAAPAIEPAPTHRPVACHTLAPLLPRSYYCDVLVVEYRGEGGRLRLLKRQDAEESELASGAWMGNVGVLRLFRCTHPHWVPAPMII